MFVPKLEHAIPLLVSSAKRHNEMQVEVGFTDARTFTRGIREAFSGEHQRILKGIGKFGQEN